MRLPSHTKVALFALLLGRVAFGAVPGIDGLVASSSNPEGVSIPGNQFKFAMPNPIGAGNCIALFFTWKPRAGATVVTVADNNANTWPSSPNVSAFNGVGSYESDLYLLPNANSGSTTITVTFGTVSTISNILWNGTTPSVPTAAAHNLVTGDTATIAGVTNTAYNNWFTSITVTDSTHFNYASTVNQAASSGGNAMLAMIPFQYTAYSLYNIATSLPLNGNSTNNNSLAPNLSTPQFTPGNNNANGGNLIITYFGLSTIAGGNPSTWTPGVNFTLGDGDIAWTTNTGYPHASQYFLQTTAAALTPTMTAIGDTVDGYNGISIALKAATAGTPPAPGIRIDRVLHFTSGAPPNTWVLQVPSQGNLLVASTNESPVITISSITDTQSNTWVKAQFDPSSPQIWYATGPAQSASTLKITLNITGTAQPATIIFHDISGAKANAFDSAATCNTGQGGPGACGTAVAAVTGTTSQANVPTITPSVANSLTISHWTIAICPC